MCGAARAQDLTLKAPPQASTTVIYNATIHPISGPVIENGSIIFEGGVIMGVLDGMPSVPIGWNAIDAKGLHVYPGLISPYSQLGLTEIQSVNATQDLRENSGFNPEITAVTAVNPDSTLLPVTRSNGVLIAGVFPTGGTLAGQPSVIRLDGWTTADMTVERSIGQVLRWPQMRPISAWWNEKPEEEQVKEIRLSLQRIADAFTTARSYANAKTADPSSPADLRWEAMRQLWAMPHDGATPKDSFPPARPVYVHAQDLDQINAAVQFCAERGLACVIIGGRDAPLAADLLKQHKVMVIVLGTHSMPRRDDAPYDDAYRLPARLASAGIAFAIATGDDTAHERNLPYAAAMAAAHGLDADEAVRSITIDAARALGIDKRYGTLERGKSATIIVTTGNPLEITSLVRRAFVDGREIDLSNKQTKLAEKYVERYRQTGDLQRPRKDAPEVFAPRK